VHYGDTGITPVANALLILADAISIYFEIQPSHRLPFNNFIARKLS
jgi:hypothetical protein